MTKCHLQQINFLSAQTHHVVEFCQLIASSFMRVRKSQITPQAGLELTNEDLLLAWQSPTHSPCHLS